MLEIAQKAWRCWSPTADSIALVAERENTVYRVDSGDQRWALRLHRIGYRNLTELQSEMLWVAALAEAGLSVAMPLLSDDGSYVRVVDGVQCSVLHWLPGQPMGSTGEPLQLADKLQVFGSLGEIMARLHQISDAWTPPEEFQRCSWDTEGLLGETPLWGAFWENPTLTTQQRNLFLQARAKAARVLANTHCDYGLIHADMLRENVHLDGKNLHILDFDDGGYGYRLFDVATALNKNRHEHDFDQIEASLLQGYQSVRPLQCEQLTMFKALRALTYVGWISSRTDEPGGQARNERLIADAQYFVEAWLGT